MSTERMTFKAITSILILLCSTAIGIAQEQKLTGAEIEALLPNIKAKGENFTQVFTQKGLTTYTYDGRPSEGRWMVQDNQYCSTWPPNNAIECYDVLVDKTQKSITWIGAGNSASKATYKILEN